MCDTCGEKCPTCGEYVRHRYDGDEEVIFCAEHGEIRRIDEQFDIEVIINDDDD